MNICPRCGLPEYACICDQISKENQKITIKTEKRRYGKMITIVSGFDKGTDIKKIAKELKNELACGGTIKNNEIELMGDHKKRVKQALIKQGFDESQIIE